MKKKIKATSPRPSPQSGEGVSNPDRSPGGAHGVTRPTTADEYRQIARGEIFPDPEQPRKTFGEAALKELADSIKEQGIVQPLIVRLVKAQFKIIEPDLHLKEYQLLKATPADDIPWTQMDRCDEKNFKSLRGNWAGNFGGLGTETDYADRYVIVAGERRWRAAALAGLATVPCLVRDLEAHRVFAQQIIENNQREGVNDIDEAEALEREFNRRKALDEGFSKEKMAVELGMSRADFYGTLVLTRLHPPVRTALLEGKISTSVAKEVAKLPTPAMQAKLLKDITNEAAWNYPFSVRDVQGLIAGDYVRQLADAPFKLDEIHPDVSVETNSGGNQFIAVAPTCKGCPHRTGNMKDEFPDLAQRPNVCTLPDCFAAKCKAHWLAETAAARAKGQTVLTEKEFKKSDYVDAEGSGNALFSCPQSYNRVSVILGKHMPKTPALVVTAQGLKEVFPLADIEAAAAKAKVKLRKDEAAAKPVTKEDKAKAEAKRAEEEAKSARATAFVDTQIVALAKLLPKIKPAKAFEIVNVLFEEYEGCGDNNQHWQPIKALKDAQSMVLARMFSDLAPWDEYAKHWNDVAVEAWKLAGIDLVKGFEASEQAAQKTLVLPKAKPEQGKLLDVKPNKPPTRKATARQGKAKKK